MPPSKAVWTPPAEDTPESSGPIATIAGSGPGGTWAPPAEDTPEGSSSPVGSEIGQLVTNITKQAPRTLLQTAGGLADLFSQPGAEEARSQFFSGQPIGSQPPIQSHPIAQMAAKEVADRLEAKYPDFFKPTYQAGNTKPLEDVANSAISSGVTGLIGGPEAVLPSMLSGTMSETAKQMGAGPVTQFAVGMGPFAAPAAIRGLVRGGEAGAARMQQAIENAPGRISVGQASGNPIIRSAEAISGSLPGGGPLRETRNVGTVAEAKVNDIIDNLKPGASREPVTAADAGKVISDESQAAQARLSAETAGASKTVEAAVGGPDRQMPAHNLNTTMQQVTSGTGNDAIDALVTGAKTRKLSKAAAVVNKQGQPIPLSYTTDAGDHWVSSPNGETQATQIGSGDLKVVRSDTAEGAQGNNEGTARLAQMADVAHAQDADLVSAHDSISPGEAAAYEKLRDQGYIVERDPNATINPATGNTIGDPDTLNPIYKVKKSPYQPQEGEHDTSPWTFGSLKAFRTQVGQAIGSTRDTVQRGQLKALYKAVSQDLSNGVATAGGQDATDAWKIFNVTAKTNAKTIKQLQTTVDRMGGFGEVFKSAIRGTKDDATRIAPIMNMMGEDGQNTFRAAYLYRLGRKGGAVDQPFDANTYLQNWRGISPEAKNVIFGPSGASNDLRQSLDSLSNNLSLMEQQGTLKSGLAKAVGQGVHGVQMVGIAGLIGFMAEHASTAMAHFAEGHPILAGGAIGGATLGAALNPIMSRVLTNPTIVRWLAKSSTLSPGAIPAALNQLNRMQDPDAQALSNLIQQQQKQGQ